MIGIAGYRPGLEQLRGVAVLLVVIGHSSNASWRGLGGIGVTLFFVLSGYLITGLLVSELHVSGRVSLRGFYARRARRLLPALVPALAFGALVNHLAGRWVLRPVVSTLTYTANYSSVGHDADFGALSHLWSLGVEEHFYLVWPVVVITMRRRLVPLCCAAIVVVSLARYHVSLTDGALAYRGSQFRIDAMLMGAVAVLVPWRPRPWMLVLSVPAIAWFAPASHGTDLLRWGLPAVSLAATVLVTRAAASTWRCRPLERVGAISYGVYLFHLPVSYWMSSLELSGRAHVVGTLVLTGVLAESSYRFLESPIRARWTAVAHPVEPADDCRPAHGSGAATVVDLVALSTGAVPVVVSGVGLVPPPAGLAVPPA